MKSIINWRIGIFAFVLLSLFIALFIFSAQMAQAQAAGGGPSIGEVMSSVGSFLRDAFGYTDIRAGSDWRFVTVLVVIFVMIFFAFSDMIDGLTAFSKTTSYILGFGLAVIAALTKGILELSRWAFAITAGLGTIGVAIIILSAFVATILIHLGVGSVEGWLKRRKTLAQAGYYAAKTAAGAKIFAEMGKQAEKEGKKK